MPQRWDREARWACLPPNLAGRIAFALRLDGLETLPAETVTALCAGDPPARAMFLELSLNGLRDLGPAAAATLAEHTRILNLDGLRTLAAETARALVSPPGKRELFAVSLRGLESLSADTARELAAALAGHRGSLFVAATAPLAVSVAWALGRHTGPSLLIAELESLDPVAAAELARHPGDLQFPHLTTLSAETATALAPHTGGLSFTKVLDLPADVAERLAAGRASSLGLGVRRMAAAAPASPFRSVSGRRDDDEHLIGRRLEPFSRVYPRPTRRA